MTTQLHVPDRRTADQKLADSVSLEFTIGVIRQKHARRKPRPIDFILFGLLAVAVVASVFIH